MKKFFGVNELKNAELTFIEKNSEEKKYFVLFKKDLYLLNDPRIMT